jgi:Flp pilus assembly protein TadD
MWHGSRNVSGNYMNRPSNVPGFPSRTELLLGRARRAQKRGECRQALVALREATLLAESDAKLWALYGSACLKANRLAEAERAFGQALYFRQRAHDAPRARSLRAMIERLGLGRAA